jgi:hypothetical protein
MIHKASVALLSLNCLLLYCLLFMGFISHLLWLQFSYLLRPTVNLGSEKINYKLISKEEGLLNEYNSSN